MIELHIRRLVCQSAACPQRTFRQQVPELALRYARRTLRLTTAVGQLAITLAGRASAAVLAGLGTPISRSTVLRVLMALPIPPTPTPTVLSVDDVALRRGYRYATMLIDAVTHQRIDVLPDRKSATLSTWLREHPGAEIVCRDGSAAYAEAIRQGAPEAVQVSDRWHRWHGLGGAVEKTVIAHSTCWRTQPAQPQNPSGPGRAIDERTRTRHAAVHTLLLAEIRELGNTGSANLLVRYLNQGRAHAERAAPPPRRLVGWIMSRPAELPEHDRTHLNELLVGCAPLAVSPSTSAPSPTCSPAAVAPISRAG